MIVNYTMAGLFDKLGDWNQVVLILLIILIFVTFVFAIKGIIWVIAKVWDYFGEKHNELKQYAQKTNLGQKILHVVLLVIGFAIVCVTIAVNIRSCSHNHDYYEDDEFIKYEHRPDKY